jgi:hypothetical protein
MIGGQTAVVDTLTERRRLTQAGLALFLTDSFPFPAPEAAAGGGTAAGGGGHYFMRARDTAATGGARHGVLGQLKHGYFEASPNHDAVAWRVVNDSLAEEIMSTIDALGERIRPHTFVLPNTDAGGGVGYVLVTTCHLFVVRAGQGGPCGGSRHSLCPCCVLSDARCSYDDMLCGDGKTCGGIFAYGQWVNGGVPAPRPPPCKT